MKGFFAALQFLSVLPVYQQFDADDLGRSQIWFPAAGLIIGICAAMVYGIILLLEFPPLVASLSGVLALAGFSGFFHLDGVADTADGFFSSRPRSQMLDIMRDSRIGAMGVIGIFIVLAFKWAALSSLPPGMGWRVLVLAAIVGRAGQVMTMTWMPYARSEGGLASVFLTHCSQRTALNCLLICLAAALILGGLKGMIALLMAGMFGVSFNLWCLRKINGMTGDTLGAVSEGLETVIMCVMCMGIS